MCWTGDCGSTWARAALAQVSGCAARPGQGVVEWSLGPLGPAVLLGVRSTPCVFPGLFAGCLELHASVLGSGYGELCWEWSRGSGCLHGDTWLLRKRTFTELYKSAFSWPCLWVEAEGSPGPGMWRQKQDPHSVG